LLVYGPGVHCSDRLTGRASHRRADPSSQRRAHRGGSESTTISNVNRDRAVAEKLGASGWRILRIWKAIPIWMQKKSPRGDPQGGPRYRKPKASSLVHSNGCTPNTGLLGGPTVRIPPPGSQANGLERGRLPDFRFLFKLFDRSAEGVSNKVASDFARCVGLPGPEDFSLGAFRSIYGKERPAFPKTTFGTDPVGLGAIADLDGARGWRRSPRQ